MLPLWRGATRRSPGSGLVPGTYTVEASVAIGGNVVVRSCGSVEAGQRGVALRLPP